MTQISYSEMNVLVGSEEAKFSQQVQHAAYANIPEKIFRSLRTSAPGFVYFARSNRFRKR